MCIDGIDSANNIAISSLLLDVRCGRFHFPSSLKLGVAILFVLVNETGVELRVSLLIQSIQFLGFAFSAFVPFGLKWIEQLP